MKKSKIGSQIFDSSKLLISQNSQFMMREAYKSLRTNVSFSLPGSGSKCIGVVSPTRGEGKSTIAINLGISFAQTNKKVIIVDCDMRLPTVASKIKIKSRPGLSNLLADTEENQEDIIQHLDDYGLDVLAAGDIPPDPTPLIDSKQMDDLIAMLKERYDYVILDFPPITMVTDAMIMSHLVDGDVVIVRHNSSEFQKISETIKQMEFANAKILGFVYNAKNKERKYYKKYYKKGSSSYYYYNYYKKPKQ